MRSTDRRNFFFWPCLLQDPLVHGETCELQHHVRTYIVYRALQVRQSGAGKTDADSNPVTARLSNFPQFPVAYSVACSFPTTPICTHLWSCTHPAHLIENIQNQGLLLDLKTARVTGPLALPG